MGNVTLAPGQLPQYFHWDKNFAMEFSFNVRFYYCIAALFTIHPLVFYILIWEPGSLSKEIRFGYIANQITLIIFEWVYGVLFGIYPLCPYPGIYCGGWLCGKGIHPQILLTIFGVAVILPSPPFEYLLLVMHQKLVQNTPSKVRLSKRTQTALIVAVTLLLALNIVGFGVFGVQTKKAEEILSRPELEWLSARDGEIFIFGDIADPESFTIECYILAATVGLIGLYVWFFSFHTIKMLKTTESAFTDETMRVQMRMITVLQYQFYGVFLCFAIPCGMMFLGVYFGTMGLPHPRTFAFCRPIFTTLHNLDSLPLSLIFLLKNQTYRRILWNKARRLVHWLTPCVDRSIAPTQTSFRPFSSMPSTSTSRAFGV